jgi:hypothetical protein
MAPKVVIHVALPDGTSYQNHTTDREQGCAGDRLMRRVKAHLKKRGYTLENVITNMFVVEETTGRYARFVYTCIQPDRWEVGIRLGTVADGPWDLTYWYSHVTYDGTLAITDQYNRLLS